MRQRITFIHWPEDSIDPKSIKVTHDSLAFSHLKAAREDRLTLGFDELPEEIRLVLEQSHELHLRYISDKFTSTISPFLSKLSPGLHVYYSPHRNSKSSSDLLCPIIHKLFGLKDRLRCQSPELSFTSLPSQRFQHSTDYEYYQPRSQVTLQTLLAYLKSSCQGDEKLCGDRIDSLQKASSIDIDFDTISHALTVNAFWPSQEWAFDISNKGTKDRIEVGVLSNEKPLEAEELQLGGFLTVVGEDIKPSPTLFSFPARHHLDSASFSASFITPTGLHPTLRLEINSTAPSPTHEACSLHAHFTLPRVIFADKYQLSDPLFLISKNLSALRYITKPVDLEAPEYTMTLWGSSLLLELAPHHVIAGSGQMSWMADIPLHLRYLPPTQTGYSEAEIPKPVVFWACTADEGSKFTINPFDRVNLGYDGLFGPRTMFYHLSTKSDVDGYNIIDVPVLNLGSIWTDWVDFGTTLCILTGFGWVLWKLWLIWWREGYQSIQKSREEHEKIH